MIINIKKQAAVGLVLASIGGLCPLQAMENNQDQDFEQDLAQAIANSLLDTNNAQQVIEDGQDGDSDLAQAIALSLTNDSHSFVFDAKNANSITIMNDVDREIKDVKPIILCNAFFQESISNGNPMNLFLVCKDWSKIIQDNFKSIENAWETHYGFTNSEYQLIKNTKVQYRPDPKSNEGMITLKIPTFANPFGHKFNLSGCGDAGKYLCMTTGYRYGMKPENKDKVEIYVAPRKLIEKNLATSAAHYEPIMTKWSNAHLVGVFYTWGNWENNNWYEYVTKQRPDDIATKNLLKLYDDFTNPLATHVAFPRCTLLFPQAPHPSSPRSPHAMLGKFHFYFEPK